MTLDHPPTAGAQVIAIEYALPDRQVTNDDLAALHPEWQMDRVVASTGVKARHWCSNSETALDLATTASRRLFKRIDIAPDQVDALLFCTQTPDYPLSPNSCLLQERLGLPRRLATLDFNLACSGFIYGLYMAKALIESGGANNVLLITADTYSKWISHDDRGTATLFGDGAAATLIGRGSKKIGRAALGTDGSASERIFVPAGGARQPRSPETNKIEVDAHGNRRTAENLWMNGPALLDFVKSEVPTFVKEYLAENNSEILDYDFVLLHQGSKLTCDYVYGALQVPRHKRLTNLELIGNTVSSSIPILIRQAQDEGVLKSGDRLLLVGFGVGLSWGVCPLLL